MAVVGGCHWWLAPGPLVNPVSSLRTAGSQSRCALRTQRPNPAPALPTQARTHPAPPSASPPPPASFAFFLQEVEEDGIEDAFELQAEVPEKIRTGLWVGDCFIYNNAAWRLNYCVGGEVTTLFHLDK